ncbi:MAG: hypothetical protein HEQ19_10090 [Gloeotrichia echinulata CP02]
MSVVICQLSFVICQLSFVSGITYASVTKNQWFALSIGYRAGKINQCPMPNDQKARRKPLALDMGISRVRL